MFRTVRSEIYVKHVGHPCRELSPDWWTQNYTIFVYFSEFKGILHPFFNFIFLKGASSDPVLCIQLWYLHVLFSSFKRTLKNKNTHNYAGAQRTLLCFHEQTYREGAAPCRTPCQRLFHSTNHLRSGTNGRRITHQCLQIKKSRSWFETVRGF